MTENDQSGGFRDVPPIDEDLGSFVPEVAEAVEEEAGSEPAPPPAPTEPIAATESDQHRVFAGTGISWAFIFGVLLTAAIIVLAVQNTDPVPIQLFFWETDAPLIIIMLVTALVVILINEMIGLIIRRRRRKVLAEREELKRLRARTDPEGPRIE